MRAWVRRMGAGGSLAMAAALGLCLVVVMAAGGAMGARKPPTASPSPTTSATPSVAPSIEPGAGVVTGRVGISAITLALELSQGSASAGRPVQVRATIVNQARESRSSIAVTLTAVPTGVSLRPRGDRLVRRLGAGDGEVVTWTACASSPGTYVFVATARVDGATTTSVPALLTISAGGSC